MRTVMLFQIFDTVGQTVIGPIIPAHHQAKAIRDFTDILADPKTTLGTHPDDYELLQIGIQDEETGSLDPMVGRPEPVLTGKQWRIMKEAAQARAEDNLKLA